MRERIFRSVIELVEKCSKIWFESLKCLCCVWHKQTVIDDHLYFLTR